MHSQTVDTLPESEHVKLMRALLAEAIGTGLIVLFGCGSVCATFASPPSGLWQVAIVWGFGVALAIYSTADASGAHLNPAITLAFLLVRPKAHSMTPRKAVLYVCAQFVGAVVCATINLLLYNSAIKAFERSINCERGDPCSIKTAAAFGEYFPNPGFSVEWGQGPFTQDDVTPLYAMIVEAWGTCILAFVIFSITNDNNKALDCGSGRPGVPFMIGMTVAVLLALYAPITQAGWNPARDLGPRLVAALGGWGDVAIPGPQNGFWVYIVGPCIGAPIGAAFAEFILWMRHSKLV
jgi:MIP family channel proteins